MKRVNRAILLILSLVVVAETVNAALRLGKNECFAQEAALSVKDGNSPPVVREAQGAHSTFSDIAAIFSKYHCSICHGGPEPRGGLSLESRGGLLKGGKHGPAVVPGNPGKSELIRRLKGISEPRMPFGGPPWLLDDETLAIEQWITNGAPEGN